MGPEVETEAAEGECVVATAAAGAVKEGEDSFFLLAMWTFWMLRRKFRFSREERRDDNENDILSESSEGSTVHVDDRVLALDLVVILPCDCCGCLYSFCRSCCRCGGGSFKGGG